MTQASLLAYHKGSRLMYVHRNNGIFIFRHRHQPQKKAHCFCNLCHMSCMIFFYWSLVNIVGYIIVFESCQIQPNKRGQSLNRATPVKLAVPGLRRQSSECIFRVLFVCSSRQPLNSVDIPKVVWGNPIETQLWVIRDSSIRLRKLTWVRFRKLRYNYFTRSSCCFITLTWALLLLLLTSYLGCVASSNLHLCCRSGRHASGVQYLSGIMGSTSPFSRNNSSPTVVSLTATKSAVGLLSTSYGTAHDVLVTVRFGSVASELHSSEFREWVLSPGLFLTVTTSFHETSYQSVSSFALLSTSSL